ncbi:MAG TPA: hypothetical protein VH054_18295 [Polyangiaceae bacterium]|jgi:hypothetical protein|nr:hypothetical protein [Polyangiaceae bacterium]
MATKKSRKAQKGAPKGISKSSTRAAKAAKPISDSVTPGVLGSEADFELFLPQAEKVAKVTPFRADASLAYHNVDAGVTAVLSQRALLDARVKSIDWTGLAALPRLALAVCFAHSQVVTATPAASDLPSLLARGRALRKLLLDAASALATAGLLPAAKVDAIRAGTSSLDSARDCVDLAAVFRANAARLKGKHAVTNEQIGDAATVGTELIKLLKPVKKEKAPELASSQDARDKLWSLLCERHVEARRLGMFVWVDDVDAHVPSLQAHRGGAHKKPKQPAAPASTNGQAATTTS